MTCYLTLLAPAHNRVYRDSAPRMAAAELALNAPFVRDIQVASIGEADAISYVTDDFDGQVIGRLSSGLVTFQKLESGDLRAVDTPSALVLADDILTIPKYQGKTNEAFTRLLLQVTLSQVTRTGPFDVLDPLVGRGTTLFAAWMLGHHGFGVESNEKEFDALSAFVKTYLRTKRIKHSARVTPVKRDGKNRGHRLMVEARLGAATNDRDADDSLPTLNMDVFTGDTRDSKLLFGKKTFDAIVTDAPYGVVHGSRRHDTATETRDRSPRRLLGDAIPVWVSQLRHGGALGISWNTVSLPRHELATMMTDAGLSVREGGPWDDFAHRVDQSINRDLMVGHYA